MLLDTQMVFLFTDGHVAQEGEKAACFTNNLFTLYHHDMYMYIDV